MPPATAEASQKLERSSFTDDRSYKVYSSEGPENQAQVEKAFGRVSASANGRRCSIELEKGSQETLDIVVQGDGKNIPTLKVHTRTAYYSTGGYNGRNGAAPPEREAFNKFIETGNRGLFNEVRTGPYGNQSIMSRNSRMVERDGVVLEEQISDTPARRNDVAFLGNDIPSQQKGVLEQEHEDFAAAYRIAITAQYTSQRASPRSFIGLGAKVVGDALRFVEEWLASSKRDQVNGAESPLKTQQGQTAPQTAAGNTDRITPIAEEKPDMAAILEKAFSPKERQRLPELVVGHHTTGSPEASSAARGNQPFASQRPSGGRSR